MKTITQIALVATLVGTTAATAQEMPAGPGKEITEQVCGGCHGVDIVASIKATRQGWETIVESMVSRGATATDAELKQVIDYLAKSFPAAEKKTNEKK